MSNYPKCNLSDTVKAGFIKDKQRYKCKNCNYYYTVLQKSGSGDVVQKRQALELYLKDLDSDQ